MDKWEGKYKPYKFIGQDESELTLYKREAITNALMTILLSDGDKNKLIRQLAEAVRDGEPI